MGYLFEDLDNEGNVIDRVEVSDCIDKVESRFELVLLLSKISRLFNEGSVYSKKFHDGKDFIRALNELAYGDVDVQKIRDLYKADFVHKTLEQQLSVDNHSGVGVEGVEGAVEQSEDTLSYVSDSISTDVDIDGGINLEESISDGFYIASDEDSE